MYNQNDYQLKYHDLNFEDKLRKYRMDHIVDYMATIKTQHVLEVGCGFDPLFFRFNDFESMDIVEPGQHFYEFTKSRIGSDQRISIVNKFIEDCYLNLTKNYDVIVVGGFLHEIDNPEEVLSLIRKIATPETIIITYVPNADSFHRLLALESGIIKSNYEFSANDKLFGRRNVFITESLKKLFIDTGFLVLATDTYFIKPFSHEQMDHLLNISFFTKEVLNGLFLMTKYLPDMGCEIFLAASILT